MKKPAPKPRKISPQRRMQRSRFSGELRKGQNYSEKRPRPKPEEMPEKTPAVKQSQKIPERNIHLMGFHNLNSIMFAEARTLIEKTYDNLSRHDQPPELHLDLIKDRMFKIRARLVLPGKKYSAEATAFKVLPAISAALKKLKREIA